MFCRKCGKCIPDDSNYCQYCGCEVQKSVGPTIDKIIHISTQEAKSGVEKVLVINGAEKPLTINIPKKIQNGQILRLHKIKLIDNNGKKTNRDFFIKIEIQDN